MRSPGRRRAETVARLRPGISGHRNRRRLELFDDDLLERRGQQPLDIPKHQRVRRRHERDGPPCPPGPTVRPTRWT